jgi:hypothetical protein
MSERYGIDEDQSDHTLRMRMGKGADEQTAERVTDEKEGGIEPRLAEERVQLIDHLLKRRRT